MHLRPLLLTACLALVALPLAAQQPATPAASLAAPFDVVIIHGHIIDGTGSPWYAGDVGIRDGRIAAIGNLARAPASAPSTPAAWWSRPASSTCWASRS